MYTLIRERCGRIAGVCGGTREDDHVMRGKGKSEVGKKTKGGCVGGVRGWCRRG